MSQTTNGYWEDMLAANLAEDEPASAHHAWVVRENVQHVIDVSPQYRVNWVSSIDGDDNVTRNQGSPTPPPIYWGITFPLMRIRSAPVSLDIRIAGKAVASTLSTPTLNISADLVPYTYPRSMLGPTTRETYFTVSKSSNSTTPTWLVDESEITIDKLLPGSIKTYTTFEDKGGSSPTKKSVSLPMVRLDVRVDGTFGSGLSGLAVMTGVQVREYDK